MRTDRLDSALHGAALAGAMGALASTATAAPERGARRAGISLDLESNLNDLAFLTRPGPRASVVALPARHFTIIPARAAGVADQVGLLEVGKYADLLVLSGHPLAPSSRISTAFIEGRKIHDRQSPAVSPGVHHS